jgi:hypothetical protein
MPLHTCEVCNAKVGELRRGRCWGCYARWVEARPVGVGARCLACGEQRRRVLKLVELHGRWQPMCFNCAGQVLAQVPVPATLEAVRAAVSRERRGRDRRSGKPDPRVFQYERRVGERRTSRDEYPQIDDEMIVEVSVEPAGGDLDDLTQIRDRVALAG